MVIIKYFKFFGYQFAQNNELESLQTLRISSWRWNKQYHGVFCAGNEADGIRGRVVNIFLLIP